jgi:hypothetical protein
MIAARQSGIRAGKRAPEKAVFFAGEYIMNQNINHVNHVIWVSQPDNQAANVARLSKLTNQQFDGPYERPDVGVRAYLSWEGGLEILSPLDVVTPVAESLRGHLAARGEGLFGIVFGVPDITAAKARADRLGYQTTPLTENLGDEPWRHKTVVMKESVVGSFMNSLFIFGEIVYKDGIFITNK